ncbi:MAG: hypothetical protein V4490_07380 [Pseudomonadota bacterium]
MNLRIGHDLYVACLLSLLLFRFPNLIVLGLWLVPVALLAWCVLLVSPKPQLSLGLEASKTIKNPIVYVLALAAFVSGTAMSAYWSAIHIVQLTHTQLPGQALQQITLQDTASQAVTTFYWYAIWALYGYWGIAWLFRMAYLRHGSTFGGWVHAIYPKKLVRFRHARSDWMDTLVLLSHWLFVGMLVLGVSCWLVQITHLAPDNASDKALTAIVLLLLTQWFKGRVKGLLPQDATLRAHWTHWGVGLVMAALLIVGVHALLVFVHQQIVLPEVQFPSFIQAWLQNWQHRFFQQVSPSTYFLTLFIGISSPLVGSGVARLSWGQTPRFIAIGMFLASSLALLGYHTLTCLSESAIEYVFLAVTLIWLVLALVMVFQYPVQFVRVGFLSGQSVVARRHSASVPVLTKEYSLYSLSMLMALMYCTSPYFILPQLLSLVTYCSFVSLLILSTLGLRVIVRKNAAKQ